MSEHQVRIGGGNDPSPPPNACQHGMGLSYALFITFIPLSQLEGIKHALILQLTPRTTTWDKDSPFAN